MNISKTILSRDKMYSNFVSFMKQNKPIEKENPIYSSSFKATHISNFISLDLSPGSRRVRERDKLNWW